MDLSSLNGSVEGTHWESLRLLLPAYRSFTRVAVGNGSDTNFWLDVWTGNQPLSETFPALFSHCTSANVSVSEMSTTGLDNWLVPRLSHAASRELQSLRDILVSVVLTGDEDRRLSHFCTLDLRLDTAQLYRVSTIEGKPCDHFEFVWRSYATPRVKFFGWLLVQKRLHCKVNLHKKKMTSNSLCELCSNADEDEDHLLFGCTLARSFWEKIGWPAHDLPNSAELWRATAPPHLPTKLLSTMLLLCCWHLWKHRHEVVFRSQSPCLQRLMLACKSDCRLWSCRLPQGSAEVVNRWCEMFTVI